MAGAVRIKAEPLEKDIMRLYETMMENCMMMDKRSVSDGMGGFTYEWTDGAEFRAAIIKDNSMQAKIAEKDGVTELYTITADKGITLDYHDVFKRVSDGQVFRVTSNVKDSETPNVSSFQFGQVSAEKWVLQ